jgi:hypothetical protein
MNKNQNIKDIDLSKMTISQLRMCVNSIYGDGKYINTPEYKEMYQKFIAEMQKRSNMN